MTVVATFYDIANAGGGENRDIKIWGERKVAKIAATGVETLKPTTTVLFPAIYTCLP